MPASAAIWVKSPRMPSRTARIGELGRQPYTARWFLTRYADRVLFGTDSTPNAATYRIYFRCLETADEYFDYYRDYHAYWKLYGMDLPDEVLYELGLTRDMVGDREFAHGRGCDRCHCKAHRCPTGESVSCKT